jgi:hypothetical protein
MEIVAWPKLGLYSTGSSLKTLQKIAISKDGECNIDLSLVHEGWKINDDEEPEDHRRAEHVRKELWKMGNQMLRADGGVWNHLAFTPNPHGEKDVEILFVSHGGSLETLERTRGSCRSCAKLFGGNY